MVSPRDSKGRFIKGISPNPKGRKPKAATYSDSLRSYYALTPKQLYAEARKPLKDRNDITVAQACAMLDAAQSMIRENAKQRQDNADRLEGKPTQKVKVESTYSEDAFWGQFNQMMEDD